MGFLKTGICDGGINPFLTSRNKTEILNFLLCQILT